MKLIALLSWYDENPQQLGALVDSLAGAGVDHLVAMDGPYRLYPASSVRSSPLEYVVLTETCNANGIDLTVHTPSARWENNEIEKRNTLFRLGHALAEPYDDWLWVIDADEIVTRADGHRAALETTDLNVATVLENENGTPKRSERRLFRAHPKGITVKDAHFFYRDGDGDVLWGPQQIPAFALDIEMFHRPLARSEQRNAARNEYYEARHGAEVQI